MLRERTGRLNIEPKSQWMPCHLGTVSLPVACRGGYHPRKIRKALEP
jgi:hypothetical protein